MIELLERMAEERTPPHTLSYTQRKGGLKLLGSIEERDLIARYKGDGDRGVLQKLVVSHMPYIRATARKLSGYSETTADLEQAGTVGFLLAIKKFDPERGVRLITFAMHYVRAEMLNLVRKNYRPLEVATTKRQRKLFYRLRNELPGTGSKLRRAEAERIAAKLSVPVDDVCEMAARLRTKDLSLSQPATPETNLLLCDCIPDTKSPDPSLLPEELNNSYGIPLALIYRALSQLEPRDQQIIMSRYLSDSEKTLAELGKKWNVSSMRILQLERRALERLRGKLAYLTTAS